MKNSLQEKRCPSEQSPFSTLDFWRDQIKSPREVALSFCLIFLRGYRSCRVLSQQDVDVSFYAAYL